MRFVIILFLFTFYAPGVFAQRGQAGVQFNITLPECFDNRDNDGDALTDYPSDPGCEARADDNETDPVVSIEPAAVKYVTWSPTLGDLVTYSDKKVLNNPAVEKVNATIAVPVIIVATAANTAAAAATTGVTFASFLTYLQGLVTQPLFLFARRRRKEWVIVYSSLTKLPIDLATVRLVDEKTNRLIATRVTDKEGRYIFFADLGSYRIKVAKPGYTFPSLYLKDKTSDLEFTDLYLGGPLEVTTYKALAFPIPIDPQERVDVPKNVRSRSRKRAIQKRVAYSGPLFAAVSFAITPNLTTTTLLALQFILLVIFKRLAEGEKPKTWATVRDADTDAPISFAVVRIFDATYNKLLETQVTDKSGRYAFLVGRGIFYITIDKPGYDSYRGETVDFSQPGSEEVIKKDINLRKIKIS